jgi:malate synthase
MTASHSASGSAKLELLNQPEPGQQHILDEGACVFIAALVENFRPGLQELLRRRIEQQAKFDAGAEPAFPDETRALRDADWQVAAIPDEVADRRTEITGPVSRKMVINALNSGAQVYMADFEDSTAPTWHNVIDGQVNLHDAVRRQIDFTSAAGKEYRLRDDTAVLMVRPRGLHLPERHIRFEGSEIPGCLVDFGLFLYHNHAALAASGRQPYFYLPKLEHYQEAAWWNRVIDFAEDTLGLERGTVRVTVLIETLPAVFQMDEILHELQDHILGLNCGRWDYIFSFIKTFRNHPDKVLPDRGQITMAVPFLHEYSKLLIRTCHRRGAFAMGGMAAFIPVKNDPEKNAEAMERVRADKAREAGDGHDGTWVAHPGLEPLARAEFDQVLSGPNQIGKIPELNEAGIASLTEAAAGSISEGGIRENIGVALQYLSAWLGGNGCVPINHLMEDAATAEISRAQLWQWLRYGARLDSGRSVTREWLNSMFEEELARLLLQAPESAHDHLKQADGILRDLVFADLLADFLTLPAYALLD